MEQDREAVARTQGVSTSDIAVAGSALPIPISQTCPRVRKGIEKGNRMTKFIERLLQEE